MCKDRFDKLKEAYEEIFRHISDVTKDTTRWKTAPCKEKCASKISANRNTG